MDSVYCNFLQISVGCIIILKFSFTIPYTFQISFNWKLATKAYLLLFACQLHFATLLFDITGQVQKHEKQLRCSYCIPGPAAADQIVLESVFKPKTGFWFLDSKFRQRALAAKMTHFKNSSNMAKSGEPQLNFSSINLLCMIWILG